MVDQPALYSSEQRNDVRDVRDAWEEFWSRGRFLGWERSWKEMLMLTTRGRQRTPNRRIGLTQVLVE